MTGASADSISLAEDLVATLRIPTPSQPATLLNVRPYHCLVELRERERERGKEER